MSENFKIEGLAELDKAIGQIDVKLARKEMRAVVRELGKPMLAEAKRRVPYAGTRKGPRGDTFSLRDFLRIRLSPGRARNRISQVLFDVGVFRAPATSKDPKGYKVAGGLSRNARAPNYAQIIEAQQPFLRPAFDSHAGKFLRNIRGELAKRIESVGERV